MNSPKDVPQDCPFLLLMNLKERKPAVQEVFSADVDEVCVLKIEVETLQKRVDALELTVNKIMSIPLDTLAKVIHHIEEQETTEGDEDDKNRKRG